jgi:FSR family fosmidomycin resistance protein-like MFS transporter
MSVPAARQPAFLSRLLPAGIDRRAIGALTGGHIGSDVFQGAVPALVPFFVNERGWSYAAAGVLVLIGSLGSSLLQPLAGAIGDRVHAPWLMPVGLLLASGGLGVAALATDYRAVAAGLAVGGFGVAAFHPEAVRAARAAAGMRPGAALGLFAVGGNAGFALGPALTVPAALAFGLRGVVLVAAVPLLTLAGLLANWRRVVPHPDTDERITSMPEGDDDWPQFLLASGVAILRTAYLFGLMAFVPAWFDEDLGSTLRLGSAAVAASLAAGALGTFIGGRLADHLGQRRVIVWSMLISLPLCALLPFTTPWLAVPLLFVLGATMDANFYSLVIVAQNALPARMGFATGVVIGLSVGFGAGTVAVLGLVADNAGLTETLHVCTGLAAVATLLTLPLARGTPGAQATT